MSLALRRQQLWSACSLRLEVYYSVTIQGKAIRYIRAFTVFSSDWFWARLNAGVGKYRDLECGSSETNKEADHTQR